MKLKKLINQYLCNHKNRTPIRLEETIEYTYKSGVINNKSKHTTSFTVESICDDCGKRTVATINSGRKYY